MVAADLEVPQMVRGSLKPDLEVTISDARGDALFTGRAAADVTVNVEQNGSVVATGQPDTFVPSVDGKSAVVTRAWIAGETAILGRMWVTVTVDWPGGKPQTFPAGEALRLDVVRAAGDA